MSTVETFQEEGAACSFAQIVLLLLLFPPEDANKSMNTVFVLSHRNFVRGWKRHEDETKAEKTADSLHVLSAAGDGGNVR